MLLFPAVFDIKPIWYTGVVCYFSLQGISVENPPWNLTFSMWLTVHSRNFLDIFLPVNTSKRGGHAEAWARHEGAAPTDSAAPLPQHLNSNLVQVSNTYNRGITWPSPRVPHLGPPCEVPMCGPFLRGSNVYYLCNRGEIPCDENYKVLPLMIGIVFFAS